MAQKRSLLFLSRKIHLYLGLVTSPALLFFAFTGVYQTLGLHEAASNYHPPRLLAELGQIHKKQTAVLSQRRPEGNSSATIPGPRPNASPAVPDPVQGSSAAPRRSTDSLGAGPAGSLASGQKASGAQDRGGPGRPQLTLGAKARQHLPLKLFFVLVGTGLFLNTLTGVYMAYKYDRNAWLVSGLLLAGLIVPLLLLPL